MRVGLFSDTYLPEINGVATSVHTLRQVLEKRGHTVFVITTKSNQSEGEEDPCVLRFSGIELKDTALLEAGHWICRAAGLNPKEQASFNIDLHNSPIKLNTRESEVLFLLLYGKKPQYIAKVLNLSVKTIENYVLRLREKFNANTKGELLDLALDHGYGSHIPPSMLKQQLSVILKE